MRRGVFAAWVGLVLGAVALQSALHLRVALDAHRVDTLVDLDRSNGLPDLLSTAALAIAALGAAALTRVVRRRLRPLTSSLVVVLSALTLADAVHEGPHPGSLIGWLVIAMVVVAAGQLALIAVASSRRAAVTLWAAGALLLASFLVNALDQIDAARFERERGEPIAEYQIVSKEGLELLGWSLVALALWDEALRRRRVPDQLVRAPASRERAPSRRRAA